MNYTVYYYYNEDTARLTAGRCESTDSVRLDTGRWRWRNSPSSGLAPFIVVSTCPPSEKTKTTWSRVHNIARSLPFPARAHAHGPLLFKTPVAHGNFPTNIVQVKGLRCRVYRGESRVNNNILLQKGPVQKNAVHVCTYAYNTR